MHLLWYLHKLFSFLKLYECLRKLDRYTTSPNGKHKCRHKALHGGTFEFARGENFSQRYKTDVHANTISFIDKIFANEYRTSYYIFAREKSNRVVLVNINVANYKTNINK